LNLCASGRYAGFGVSVIGIVAYRGPYFGVYDTLKEINPYKKEKGFVGLASKFGIAQITAIVAGFISYPFDTVRRRLQMQAEKPVAEQIYRGTLHCAATIVKAQALAQISMPAVCALVQSLLTIAPRPCRMKA
jgi:solute carrier family 25 (adenine nucleotide translocator) protein 4/5/6/31